METYCFSCKKNTAKKNSSIKRTTVCAACDKKKLRFIKNQEVHLRQPRFIYSACGTFTKHCKRILKFKETSDLKPIYRNELDKACFVYNAVYSGSRESVKRIASDKILKNEAHEIARNPKNDGYQRVLTSMVHKIFGNKIRSRASVNEDLAEELHKPAIK